MKGLEALRKLSETDYLNIPIYSAGLKEDEALWYVCVIRKELKALDIIRNKRVPCIDNLVVPNKLLTYNDYHIRCVGLTEEESKLLKEVLG